MPGGRKAHTVPDKPSALARLTRMQRPNLGRGWSARSIVRFLTHAGHIEKKNQISLAVIGHVCETASYKKMEEKERKS